MMAEPGLVTPQHFLLLPYNYYRNPHALPPRQQHVLPTLDPPTPNRAPWLSHDRVVDAPTFLLIA